MSAVVGKMSIIRGYQLLFDSKYVWIKGLLLGLLFVETHLGSSALTRLMSAIWSSGFLADRRLKVCDIGVAVGSSKDYLLSHGLYLTWNIGYRKRSPRWVHHLHTPDSKRNRSITSYQYLTLFKRKPEELLCPFVTSELAWIPATHHRPKDSLNSGLYTANLLIWRQRLPYWPKR